MVRALSSLSLLAAASLFAASAHAFVTAPVGGHPGEVDARVLVGFERGKVEPNEYQGSWQKADWNVFVVGGGYTIGKVGPFQDFYVRMDHTFYSSPAESNADEVRVGSFEQSRVSAGKCLGKVLGEGLCQFHEDDDGWLITPQVGANLVHEATHSFGVFLQGTIPVGVNFAKLTIPRVDYVAGGTTLGVHVTPWFGYVSRIYLGSGAFGRDKTQNAAIAVTSLFNFEARKWLLPWKAGVFVGPYFEGDLTERFDERYDAAYSPPDRPDRIRSMKFGLALLPYMRITEHGALSLGYVQKLFGYDAPATQFWYAEASAAF
jgi:hypothetical protein